MRSSIKKAGGRNAEEICVRRFGQRGRDKNTQKKPVTGEIVTLCRLIREDPGYMERFRVPEWKEPLRLWYGREKDVYTIIDAAPQ